MPSSPITMHATPAAVHDSVPYLRRLDRQRERFGFQVQAVGLDAGYATAALAQGLEERGIYGVTGYRRPNHGEGLFMAVLAFNVPIATMMQPADGVLRRNSSNGFTDSWIQGLSRARL